MSNFSPYSSFSVASLKKETTAGTAVQPDTAFAFLSESIEAGFGELSVQEMSGERIRDIRSVPDKIELGGDIEFLVEPKRIGDFLRSILGAPTTQTLTSSVAYRHMFEVTDTPKTYTIDIQPSDAPWVHRFFGVQVNKIAFSKQDNLIKCVVSVMPRKAFILSRVTASVSSGTTLTVDQTSGLTTGDTLLAIDGTDGYTTLQTFTIASIDSETQVTVNETITASIVGNEDYIVIKRQSLSYDQSLEFTWLGGSQLYTGDDVDNTTAEDFEDFSIEFVNEVEPRYFAGVNEEARYAGDIVTKGFSGSGNIMKFYNSQSHLDKARKNEKIGLRVYIEGETALEANSATKARTYWGSGNGFYVEASTAGKAGNDINVTLVIAADDNLAVSKSGNNITVSLANATASKNTGTLIASAINALSGVDSAAEGTGATQFTSAVANCNLGTNDHGASTSPVVGRDASEKPYMQIDLADVRLQKFSPNASEDSILEESIPLKFYKDTVGQIRKNWLTRIYLVNSVTSY